MPFVTNQKRVGVKHTTLDILGVLNMFLLIMGIKMHVKCNDIFHLSLSTECLAAHIPA